MKLKQIYLAVTIEAVGKIIAAAFVIGGSGGIIRKIIYYKIKEKNKLKFQILSCW